MTYKLINEDKEGEIIDSIELSNYEYKSALTMHKRMAQKKER